MAKKGKKYSEALKLVDRSKSYDSKEAIELVKKASTAKFDETVEAAFRLGVDPRKLTNKSVVQWYCHTVQVKHNVYLSSQKGTKQKRLKRQALTM